MSDAKESSGWGKKKPLDLGVAGDLGEKPFQESSGVEIRLQ